MKAKKKKEVNKETGSKKRLRSAHYFFLSGLICVLIAGFLGFRYFSRIHHRPPLHPRETNVQLVQSWMTLPYIARTYRIPISVLWEKLQVDPKKDERSSLETIAQDENKTPEEIVEKVKATITEFQKLPPAPPLPK